MKGTITLYTEGGRRLIFYRYASKTQRNKILEQWKGFYGNTFKTCYYQIQPDTEELPIRKRA